MFEHDMVRLEHEIDEALLFYYAAQCPEEREQRLTRAVEASLERLQCCQKVLLEGEKVDDFRRRVTEYLRFSEYALQEGLSAFYIANRAESSYWYTLLTVAFPLYASLEKALSITVSTSVRCV